LKRCQQIISFSLRDVRMNSTSLGLENSKTIFKEFENFINSIHASIETDESTGRWNCGGLEW